MLQTIDPQVVIAVIGAIVWLVRLEGRVNTADTRFKDLKDDVTYIRDRIDEVIGHQRDDHR